MSSKAVKIVISISLAFIALMGLISLLQGTISTAGYRAQIENLIREKTGTEPIIRGEVTITLLPRPTLIIPNLDIRDRGDNALAPSFLSERIYIRPSFSSLFGDRMEVESITFERPTLEIVRDKNAAMRWGWLAAGLLPQGDRTVYVSIVDGGIVYRNLHADKETLIENINVNLLSGKQPATNGVFTVNGHSLSFEARTESPKDGASALPVAIAVSSDKKTSLTLEGTVDLSSEWPMINGKVVIAGEDALAWIGQRRVETESTLDIFSGPAGADKAAQKTALPFTLSGRIEQSNTQLTLHVEEFQGIQSSGKGKVTARWDGELPDITSEFDFSSLSYDAWKLLLGSALSDRAISEAITGKAPGAHIRKNPFPSDIKISVAVKAETFYYGTQTWKNITAAATLEGGAMTINQLQMLLPGDSSLSIFGLISQGPTREMRFEGTMESTGKSLRDTLTVIDASAGELPEKEFGAFSVRSNIYIAPDQIRLSEADLKIGDLHLNGGLVAYYNVIPRFEADVQLSDINFDYFRDAWRERRRKNQPPLGVEWLKKLKASFDLKIKVDGFTLLEQEGEQATFRLFVQEGEITVYDGRFKYAEDMLQGSLSLDVKGEKPAINLLLNVGALDMAYFRLDEEAKPFSLIKDGEWSEQLIIIDWLEGWRGGFDISVGKLLYEGNTFENVKLRAGLENGVLTVPSLVLTYWQGKWTASGSLYGGKVPGFTASFGIYNVEAQEALRYFVERENIAGKMSISGSISTSGVNALSWVKQAESELVVSGSTVKIDRFSLQSVVDAVGVSRTSADVLNNVNLSLAKGSTEMTVEGNVNLKSGMVRTPALILRSGGMAGTLAGEISLLSWKTELTTLYQFPNLNPDNIPTMIVQLIGPVEDPKMTVDTASLEAYVAKRITGSSVGR